MAKSHQPLQGFQLQLEVSVSPKNFSKMTLYDHFIEVMFLVIQTPNHWPGVLKNLESFCKANMATDN